MDSFKCGRKASSRPQNLPNRRAARKSISNRTTADGTHGGCLWRDEAEATEHRGVFSQSAGDLGLGSTGIAATVQAFTHAGRPSWPEKFEPRIWGFFSHFPREITIKIQVRWPSREHV